MRTPTTLMLFEGSPFAGGATVYFGIIPMAWPFFLSFQSTGAETALPIQLEARVSEYLDLIMTLIFAFGLCFQLPVLLKRLKQGSERYDGQLHLWQTD